MRISAPSSRWQITWSGLRITMSPTTWMSPAVIVEGPDFFTTMRFGPSPCILTAISLMLRTMSVTSSRTPGIEENSCSTPSMCTDCTAAPCSEERSTRRSALPKVTPKPRSKGSATTVATRFASPPAATCSFSGRISSCQFFWITVIMPSQPVAGFSRASRSAQRDRFNTAASANARRNETLDAPALARPAAIVRDRRHVTDRRHGEPRSLQRTQRGLAARAGSCDLDFERAHAVLLRLLRGILRRNLRGERRRLARAFEAVAARRRPSDRVALRVGDGDHGVVERRVHMRDARRDVLALAAADALLCGFLAHARPCCGPLRKLRCMRACLTLETLNLLLLARDGLCRPLACAGVGVRALTAHRKPAAMTQAPIAAEIHQPLDVELDFAPQIALDHVVAVDHFTDVQHLLIGELRHAPLAREIQFFHDLGRVFLSNPMNVLQRNNNALVGRKVDTSDTSHVVCSCCRLCRPFSPLPVRGENAKCRDDTRPSARAGIGVVLMQNGCRVLKDSKSFRQPLLMTELTPSRLPFSRFFDGLGRPLRERRFLCRLGSSGPRVGGRLGYLPGTRLDRL